MPCSGRGSPCAARSGIDSLRCVFEIGSTQCGGTCLIAMPISWAGMPAVARRTICGGVRTDRRDRRAPPSITSCAISAPEFPAPTTSTSRSRNGSGFMYAGRVDELAGEAVAAGPIGNERRAVVARRDDHVLGAQSGLGPSRAASRLRRARSGRRAYPCARRGRAVRRSRGSTRAGRRARPSGRSGAGCAGPAGRRGAAACGAAAGRSADATRRRAPGLPRARAARSRARAEALPSQVRPSRRRRSRARAIPRRSPTIGRTRIEGQPVIEGMQLKAIDKPTPTPQPERREAKVRSPGLRDLSFADWKAIVIRAFKKFMAEQRDDARVGARVQLVLRDPLRADRRDRPLHADRRAADDHESRSTTCTA